MQNGVMQMFMVNLEHISYVEQKNTNTSIGRAEAIKNDLETLELGEKHLQEYFVSGCYDGQYIKADIETNLKTVMKLPEEFDCFWDYDHELELRDKNVKAEIEWSQKTLDFTNQVNNAFSHSEKKTQLMVQQNSYNMENNVKNKTIKGHSKVIKSCMHLCANLLC